jgi:hypothetical protein
MRYLVLSVAAAGFVRFVSSSPPTPFGDGFLLNLTATGAGAPPAPGFMWTLLNDGTFVVNNGRGPAPCLTINGTQADVGVVLYAAPCLDVDPDSRQQFTWVGATMDGMVMYTGPARGQLCATGVDLARAPPSQLVLDICSFAPWQQFTSDNDGNGTLQLASLGAVAAVTPLYLHLPVASTGMAAEAEADTIVVAVGTAALPPGLPVPPNFASFSMEVNDALAFLGTAEAPNLAFANLVNVLRNASAMGGGGLGPTIRIGGNSADYSLWWPPGSGPLPPNQTYAITEADLRAYGAALPLFDGSIVIDTNFFVQDDTSRVSAHVAAVDRLLGWDRVVGVEVGNEVEIYHDDGFRPPKWSEADYETEWRAHVAAAEAAGMPRGRVQGAVFCCNNSEYDAAFAGYAKRYAPLLASLSYHHYALGGCEGKVTTLQQLLQPTASSGSASFLAPFATAARAAGIKFVIGEGNSCSCGGRAGVSDVFGTALWALDMLLAVAEVGVSSWNFHGGPQAGNHYTAIAFPNSPQKGTTPEVRPLYYGMWAAAVATAGGGVPWAQTVRATNPAVVAHTLVDSAGGVRVAVMHKDLNATADCLASVVPPSASVQQQATLYRLAAGGNASATHGVSFMGQTFDGSADGLPLGAKTGEVVKLVDGAYAFRLPPRSAAILVIPSPR